MNVVTVFFFSTGGKGFARRSVWIGHFQSWREQQQEKKRSTFKSRFPVVSITAIDLNLFFSLPTLLFSVAHSQRCAFFLFFSFVLVARVLFSDICSCCCAPCKKHTHTQIYTTRKKSGSLRFFSFFFASDSGRFVQRVSDSTFLAFDLLGSYLFFSKKKIHFFFQPSPISSQQLDSFSCECWEQTHTHTRKKKKATRADTNTHIIITANTPFFCICHFPTSPSHAPEEAPQRQRCGSSHWSRRSTRPTPPRISSPRMSAWRVNATPHTCLVALSAPIQR